MAYKALPSQEVLRQLLRYEPETGKLFWQPRHPSQLKQTGQNSAEHRAAMFNRNFAHTEAFTCRNNKGYRAGMINQTAYVAHRVIWKMQTGSDPTAQIDHINGNREDNRWCNLREAEAWQNQGNRKKNACARYSQYRGVCVAKGTGLWTAAINLNGKQNHLGSFQSEEDAARAYDAAAHAKYGRFARLNFPDEAA